jgi:hypothetical protein
LQKTKNINALPLWNTLINRKFYASYKSSQLDRDTSNLLALKQPSRFPGDDGTLNYACDSGVFVAALETVVPSMRKRVNREVVLRGNPLVLLCFGQSNAANTGQGFYSPRQPVYCFNFFDGAFYLAEDPLPGATGNGACPWGRVGDLLIESGRGIGSVLFINIAVGGSFLAEWIPGGPHNRRLSLAIERVARVGLRVDRLLWCQGEAEANLTNMGREQYKSQFHDMLRDVRDLGLAAPVHIAQSTFCATSEHPYDNRHEIRSALAELVDPPRGRLPGPDTDVIGLEGRTDGCHFNEIGLCNFGKLGKATIECCFKNTKNAGKCCSSSAPKNQVLTRPIFLRNKYLSCYL